MNYLSVTPIRDAAGRLSHFVGVQSDITELVNHKKAELAAKHAAVQARCPAPCGPHHAGTLLAWTSRQGGCSLLWCRRAQRAARLLGTPGTCVGGTICEASL